MDSKEGFDIVKMAITVLLLVLLIGAALSVFYMLTDKTNDYVKSMSKANNSVNMDKFREMGDMCKNEEYVLVTVVASAIQEFKDDDLLYIRVVGAGNDIVYTYDGVNLSSLFQGTTTTTTTVKSSVPTSMCAKQLLQYTDKRCKVEVDDLTEQGFDMSGITITIQ